jgi:hypothetical protein
MVNLGSAPNASRKKKAAMRLPEQCDMDGGDRNDDGNGGFIPVRFILVGWITCKDAALLAEGLVSMRLIRAEAGQDDCWHPLYLPIKVD